jgi:homoserine kinase
VTSASASAPATAANLGPAFDTIALAIELRCQVTATPADEWSVEHVGPFRPAPGDRDAVVLAARRAVGEEFPLALEVNTVVPLAKGLGSSAAAFVSGVAAALRARDGDADFDTVYRIAAELEGHDDQVAASVYGGLMVVPGDEPPLRLPLHPSLRPILAVPEVNQPTGPAREILEPRQPLDLVIRTLGRVSVLTAGLITGDPAFLAAAHGDEIHEGPRNALGPVVARLMEVGRQAGALHVSRSGAGPSVLALADADGAARVTAAFADLGVMVIDRPIATTGLI